MLISLIIPVYNAEKYLEETLNSVIGQFFTDYEVILVDDGSTDKSGVLCDQFAAVHKNISVLHKKNGGQSSARNMGIRAAKGEFLTFLDSDDLLCDKDFFTSLSQKMEGNTDIILFRYYKYYSPGLISDCGISMSGLNGCDKTNVLYELVKRDAFFCSCWSKCVRRSLIMDNNLFFDENLICEDMDWYFSVIEKAKNIVVIDKPFVYYRQHPNSVTASFKPESIEGFIFTVEKWEKIFQEIDDPRIREILLSALAKLYCNLLISFSRHQKELQNQRRRIFNLRHLLKYNLNPRTKKIWLCEFIFGIRFTCSLISILDKISGVKKSMKNREKRLG